MSHHGLMDSLVDRWPTFAAELEETLRAAGEPDLAEQVHALRVAEVCSCGDDFCQSFATTPAPEDGYGDGHRNVHLDAPWPGYLVLDVVDGEIVFVEVLYRPDLD